MTTLQMKILIDDYDRAKTTLQWLADYDDGGDRQIQVTATVMARSTPGAKEVGEVLVKVAPGAAKTIRAVLVDWCNSTIASFPTLMAECLADEKARRR